MEFPVFREGFGDLGATSRSGGCRLWVKSGHVEFGLQIGRPVRLEASARLEHQGFPCPHNPKSPTPRLETNALNPKPLTMNLNLYPKSP